MKRNSLKKRGFYVLIFFFTVFSGARVTAAQESFSVGSLIDVEDVAKESLGIAALKDLEVEIYGGWESEYASEGRKDLAQGGIYIFGAGVGYKGFLTAFDYVGERQKKLH